MQLTGYNAATMPTALATASTRTSGRSSASALPSLQTPVNLAKTSLFDAVDLALDLSRDTTQGATVMGAYNALDATDRNAFLSTLSGLLKQGVVGTETLDVNGESQTTFVDTRLGDPRLMHAKTWRGATATAAQLDLRA